MTESLSNPIEMRIQQDSVLYNRDYYKHQQDKGISILAEPTPE